MVDDVWDRRAAHQAEVDAFVVQHDPKVQRFLSKQKANRTARQNAVDEARRTEADEQLARRPYNREEVVSEGEYIVNDLMPDHQATLAPVGEQLPNYEPRQRKLSGSRQNQTDEYLLEQLQFGDTDHAEAAQRILANDRIRKPDAQYPKAKGDTALEPYYQRALRVRAKNLEMRGQAWDLPADVRPQASAQSQINELSVQQAAPNDTFGPENTIA